jgi:hypothetical protein
MNFHEYYSKLLEKLPPSIKKNIWNRLISRLHNPLTEEQASSIHPDIEILITSEIDKYEKKKNQQRIKTFSIQNSEIRIQARPEETILKDHIQVINSEKEINTRVKEATDVMHQKFIETTQETLKSIKQQKEAECKQIKLDMAKWNTKLFESTLKKYIRDGTIYNLIHELEDKDGKLYPDVSIAKH